MKSVKYQGELLARGSRAFELLDAADHKALADHLKRLSSEAATRGDIPRGTPKSWCIGEEMKNALP